MTPTILYGIDAAATRSTGSNAANVNSFNLGPFINGKLSRELDFDLAGGGTLVDTKPSVPPLLLLRGDSVSDQPYTGKLLFSASHDLVFTTGTDLTEETMTSSRNPTGPDTFDYLYRFSFRQFRKCQDDLGTSHARTLHAIGT